MAYTYTFQQSLFYLPLRSSEEKFSFSLAIRVSICRDLASASAAVENKVITHLYGIRQKRGKTHKHKGKLIEIFFPRTYVFTKRQKIEETVRRKREAN